MTCSMSSLEEYSIMSEERETLTKNDLNRVFIRTQDDKGEYVNISCHEATDKQFDIWARSRMEIQGSDGPWSPEERADFCNQLYQAVALSILKKGIELE